MAARVMYGLIIVAHLKQIYKTDFTQSVGIRELGIGRPIRDQNKTKYEMESIWFKVNTFVHKARKCATVILLVSPIMRFVR